MSKAILVIDLGNADSDYYFIDYVVRNKETGNTLESGYNVNLKPMPKELDPGISDDYVNYCQGFNDCLDEILGEK